MKRVIVESPYSGDIFRNTRYLQRCLRDCILRGESPYASHQMLTQCLDEHNSAERAMGIEAGYVWWEDAEKIVFYTDLGWSRGMRAAWKRLHATGELDGPPYELRALDSVPCEPPPEEPISAAIKESLS